MSKGKEIELKINSKTLEEIETILHLSRWKKIPKRMYREELEEYNDFREDYLRIAPEIVNELETMDLGNEYFERKVKDIPKNYTLSKEKYIFSDSLGLLRFGRKINEMEYYFLDDATKAEIPAMSVKEAAKMDILIDEESYRVSKFAHSETLVYLVDFHRLIEINEEGHLTKDYGGVGDYTIF